MTRAVGTSNRVSYWASGLLRADECMRVPRTEACISVCNQQNQARYSQRATTSRRGLDTGGCRFLTQFHPDTEPRKLVGSAGSLHPGACWLSPLPELKAHRIMFGR